MKYSKLRLIRQQLGLSTSTLSAFGFLLGLAVSAGFIALWAQSKQHNIAVRAIFFQQQHATLSHWHLQVDRTLKVSQRVDKGLSRYKGELAYLTDSQTSTLEKAVVNLGSATAMETGALSEVATAVTKTKAAWLPLAYHHEDLLTSRNKYLSPSKKHYLAYKEQLAGLTATVGSIAARHKAELYLWADLAFFSMLALTLLGSTFLLGVLNVWAKRTRVYAQVLATVEHILPRRLVSLVTPSGEIVVAFSDPEPAVSSRTNASTSRRSSLPLTLAEEEESEPHIINWRKPSTKPSITHSGTESWTSETWFEFTLPANLKLAKDHPVWISPIGGQSLGYDGPPATDFTSLLSLVHPDERYTFVQVLRTHLQDISGKTRFNLHLRLLDASGAFQPVEIEAHTQRTSSGAPFRIRGYWRAEEISTVSSMIGDLKLTVSNGTLYSEPQQEVTLSLPGTFRLKGQGKVNWGPEALEMGLVGEKESLSLTFQQWVGHLHPDDLDAIKAEWDWLQEHHEEVERFYWQFRHRNTQQHWVMLSLQGVVIKGAGPAKRLATVATASPLSSDKAGVRAEYERRFSLHQEIQAIAV